MTEHDFNLWFSGSLLSRLAEHYPAFCSDTDGSDWRGVAALTTPDLVALPSRFFKAE